MLFVLVVLLVSCVHDGYKNHVKSDNGNNVLFLHHSTGRFICMGNMSEGKADVFSWFEKYNEGQGKNVNFIDREFPKARKSRFSLEYGWKNYPFDYYNIWVKNGDKKSFKNEPTLKTLALLWDVIIFKHCYPVSAMIEDDGNGDINSEKKTLPNYKLQYNALKEEMKKYPETKFIVWTGAALTEKETNETSARLAKEFFSWVKEEWDEEGDNIYVWDYYELETEGELYLKDEYAVGEWDSHPNKAFSAKVAPLFCQRVVDVMMNDGTKTNLKGEVLGDDLQAEKDSAVVIGQ